MSHSLDQSVATGAACDLKREDFFCDTLVNLAGTLENYLGIEDASTFIARVGGDMGDAIGARYVDSDGALPKRSKRSARSSSTSRRGSGAVSE